MYNYGSPRVGNFYFKKEYNERIPDAYRVVVDGDIVTGVPRGGYSHVGNEVLIDGIGSGSIIIEPSPVERRMRIQSRSHISVHSLAVYRRGLQGILNAAAYLSAYVETMDEKLNQEELIDPVRLAIQAKKRQSTLESLEEAKEFEDDSAPAQTHSDEYAVGKLSKESSGALERPRFVSRGSIDAKMQNVADMGVRGVNLPMNVHMDDESRQFDKEYGEHSFFLNELRATKVLRPNLLQRFQGILQTLDLFVAAPIRSAFSLDEGNDRSRNGSFFGGRQSRADSRVDSRVDGHDDGQLGNRPGEENQADNLIRKSKESEGFENEW
jgi:hypothetical protein